MTDHERVIARYGMGFMDWRKQYEQAAQVFNEAYEDADGAGWEQKPEDDMKRAIREAVAMLK